jgi:hypothetical protein
MSPITITVRVDSSNAASALGGITSAAQGTASAMQQAGRRAAELQQEIARARSAGDMQAMMTASAQLANHLNAAGQAAGNLGQGLNNASQGANALASRFQSVQDIGAKLSDWGSAGLAMSANFVQAAQEGGDALAKLDAMLQKRGEGGRFQEMADWSSKLSTDAFMPDDDPVNKASAGLLGFGVNADKIKAIMPGLIGQSRLYNQSLESTAMAFGKAFSKGDAGALVKSGVTLDPADLAKLKGVEDHTQRQAMLFEMVKKSMDQYALSMNEGLSESTKQANLAANAMDSFTTNVGQGAAEAKGSFQGIGTSVLDAANQFPELEKGLGKVFYVASAGASIFGQGLGLAGQIGMATIAFPGLATAGTTALGAITTAAGTARTAVAGLLTGIGGAVIAGAALGVGIFEATRNKDTTESTAEQLSKPGENIARLGGRIRESFLQGDENQYDHQQVGNYAEEQSAKLIKKLQAKKGGAAPAPSPLAAAMTTGTSTSGGASALAGVLTTSTSGSDIESLEDQIAGSTSKSEKAGLHEQLRLAHRGQRHVLADARDRAGAEREAGQAHRLGLRNAGLAASGDAAEEGGAIDEREEGLKAAGQLSDFRDKHSLLSQLRVIKGDTGLSKDDAQAKESALKALFEARDKARKADLDEQIASLEAQKALSEAGAKASALEGSARDAALRIGQAHAGRIREVARMKAQLAREEAGDDAKAAREELGKHQGGQGHPNALAGLLAAQRLRGSYDRSGGLATAGGRAFGIPGGNYGGGPSFTGTSMQRLRDAASSQQAFSRLGFNRYGENPSEGGAQRGQGGQGGQGGGQARTLEARVESIVNDILGKTIVQFAPLPLAGQEPGPRRSG